MSRRIERTYAERRALQNAYHRQARNARLVFVNEIKARLGCKDCGIKDPRVLEFDHLPQFKKTLEISLLVNGFHSFEEIQAEIDKCEVRCANCHRLKTIERRKQILTKTPA